MRRRPGYRDFANGARWHRGWGDVRRPSLAHGALLGAWREVQRGSKLWLRYQPPEPSARGQRSATRTSFACICVPLFALRHRPPARFLARVRRRCGRCVALRLGDYRVCDCDLRAPFSDRIASDRVSSRPLAFTYGSGGECFACACLVLWGCIWLGVVCGSDCDLRSCICC